MKQEYHAYQERKPDKGFLPTLLFLVLFLAFGGTAYAQSRTVTGQVVDDTDSPLPGVAIQVKGTTKGTITDIDGNYSIRVDDGATLIFSYVGYASEEVEVGSQSEINMTLMTDINQLSEIVVVGYGTKKRSDVTGAITSVGSKEIAEVPAPNVTQALQGRLAGVQIESTSSRPGGEPRIRVRGNRSLGGNAANEPLIVLDGIPYLGSINSINQGDIQSIDVLKDASATAIYGSRGANGVILITTKRGRAGEGRVSYNGYYGFSEALDNYEVFNGSEFADLVLNSGFGPLTSTEIDNLIEGSEVNWQDLMLKSGYITNHELGFSGGTEKTQYLFSGNFFKETNALPGQSFNRNSLRITIDHKISERVKIGISNQTSYNISQGESQNPFFDLLTLSPLYDPYTETGDVNRLPAIGHIDDQRVNPLLLYNEELWESDRRQLRSFNSMYGEVEIIDGLKYRLNVGLDASFTRRGNFISQRLRANAPSEANMLNNHGFNYTIENILLYNKTFAEKHNFDFTGLFSVQEDQFAQQAFNATGIANDQQQFYDFNEAGTVIANNPAYSEWGIVSYMGRINYSFDDRYLFTLTGRIDGSSRLADGNKYFAYPAAAVGWNLSNESFMQDVNFVSNLKLRAGYGQTSNQAIQPFQSLGLLGTIPYSFGEGDSGLNGYEVTNVPNANLSWEFTTTANVGVDFGFLTNRITGSVEVYQSDTEDILQDQVVPAPVGIGSGRYRTNIGETRNRGLEVALNALVVEPSSTNGFSFEIDANFTTWREEITQLVDTLTRDIGNAWFVGEPINVIFDYQKQGIWQLGEEEQALEFDGRVPGDIRVADLNGNGIRDAEDRTVLGTTNPDWLAGLTARFGYKGFDLSVVSFARVGGLAVSRFHQANIGFPIATMEGRRNQARVDYWTPDNPTNDYPRAGLQSPAYGSTLGYFDASFMKIRSINMGYTIPNSVLENIGLKSGRVYFVANNPFKAFFSDLVEAGVPDPEPNGTGDSPTAGFGAGSQRLVVTPDSPIMRSFIFGINAQF